MQLSRLVAGAFVATSPSAVSGLHQFLQKAEDRQPQKFPQLCDSSIVAETCALFGGKAAAAPRDVAATLAATDDAVLGLWQTLKLQGSKLGGAHEETCANMCDAVVKFFREQKALPPTSDAGCYLAADGQTVCDLDLSPTALHGLTPKTPTKKPNTATYAHLKGLAGGNSSLRLLSSSKHSSKSKANASSTRAANLATVHYDTKSLARRVANMFRIYPKLDNDIRGAAGGLALTLQPADWRSKAEQIGTTAQAYVSTAVRRFKVKNTESSMKKWFGEDAYTDEAMRGEIARVLNSIAHVLSKTSYISPGSHCDASTAGYVDTSGGDGTYTPDGKFLVFLCPLFFNTELPVQIETLTHEASHHSTAYMEDVCLSIPPVYLEKAVDDFAEDENLFGEPWPLMVDGQQVDAKAMLVKGDKVIMRQYTSEEERCPERAYSRPVCAQLAKDDPILAVRNADSMCYYIQDITDAPKP